MGLIAFRSHRIQAIALYANEKVKGRAAFRYGLVDPYTKGQGKIVNHTYLNWIVENTRTKWWHDSAAAAELDLGLQRGAVGATTNPVLASTALKTDRAQWTSEIDAVQARSLPAEQRAEALMHIPVTRAAAKFAPEFAASRGHSGFVCAQVNPARAGDRECMLPMAKRLQRGLGSKYRREAAGHRGRVGRPGGVRRRSESPSPRQSASTVPQVVAIAERHRAGSVRARAPTASSRASVSR